MEDFLDPALSDPLAVQMRAADKLKQQQVDSAAWRSNPRAARYIQDVQKVAYQTGIPEDLFGNLIDRESKFDPQAHSATGAMGIAQLMPIHNAVVNPMDPKAAMNYSGKYLAALKNRFGDWPKALAAYNLGPTNFRKVLNQHGANWKQALPPETQAYVQALAPEQP